MKRFYILLSTIIGVAATLCLTSVWNDSPIVDEIPHIGAGYSYVVSGDYRFNPEHPPLAKDLAGLALLPLDLNQAALSMPLQGNWPSDVHGQWNLGRTLIYLTGNDAIKVVHAAKMPMLLFFIISALIVFTWSRKLYGNWQAILATFLFCLSPTIIAHSRFVTTDIAALFGVLLSSYFFIKYIEKPSRSHMWLSAITFGIALLTKFSTFLLVPYFLIVALVWGLLHKQTPQALSRTILIMALGLIVIVGPVYQYHVHNYPPALQKADTKIIFQNSVHPAITNLIVNTADKPVLRPFAQYFLGLTMVFQRNAGGNRTYFLGELYNHGLKSYFPIVYFLKEPLPFWGLVLMLIIAGAYKFKNSKLKVKSWIKNNFQESALLIWLVIYWYFSITANVNIGIRHLIPVYGFTYILVAGQIGRV
ncbi:glycosyltransferase family 39 protein [Candidatus Parcubacteria bacterium]|nr:glycosyltransferase family 39 protein [Candidatus Parcubacteria bacterium]